MATIVGTGTGGKGIVFGGFSGRVHPSMTSMGVSMPPGEPQGIATVNGPRTPEDAQGFLNRWG